MQRLISHLEYSAKRHRAESERGAIAVMTALALVVLLAFAALAIDVGMMYEERAQLQSGADAAALAIAQDCAANTNCADASAVLPRAQQMANSNARDNRSAASILGLDKNAGNVRVRTSAVDGKSGAGSLVLTFAPVLGVDKVDVAATSTATWAGLKKGPAVLPIVFSPCDFRLDSGPQVLNLHGGTNDQTSYAGGCKYTSSGGSGANLPAGFGLISTGTDQCTVTVDVGQKVPSTTGNSLTGVCKPLLDANIGQAVLLPVFRNLGGTGSTGWYEIDGWAAFKLLGYRFPGFEKDNQRYPGATCTSPCTGIIGQFERFSTLGEGFTSGGATNYGAVKIWITE